MLEILGRVRESGGLAVWGRGGEGFRHVRLREKTVFCKNEGGEDFVVSE